MKILLFPFDNPRKYRPRTGLQAHPCGHSSRFFCFRRNILVSGIRRIMFFSTSGLDRGKTRYSVRPEGITSLAETLGWPIWADHRRQKTNASLPHRENLPIGRTGSDHLRDHEGGTTIPILLRPEDQGMGLSEAGGSTGARSFSQQQAILQV